MSLNENTIQNGILESIQYPTGGSTHFEYGPNLTDGKYVGGLRIKRIKNIDATGIYNDKRFKYAELKGWSMEDRTFTTKNQGGGARSYYSSFVAQPGASLGYMPGYFYGKVTITSRDNTRNFKEEHFYEEDTQAGHKYQYALTEKKYYKENSPDPIKTVEYANGYIGDAEELRWNVLGDMMCFGVGASVRDLGHNNEPTHVYYRGNYAYLPIEITTTDFLGANRQPVTTLQHISYDGETLLKTQEITDTGHEIITTDYQYPWSPGINLPSLPPALPMSKIVHSNKHGDAILGQYFEYDSVGNIKRTYQYNKGKVGNNGAPAYVPSNYEEMANFLFSNGKPVQVLNKDGEPTTYIWGLNGQFPVAKIEGKARALIPQYIIDNVEGAEYADLTTKLAELRGHPALAGAMVTTFTYKPLAGVETITDPKGDKQNFEYDPFGRLILVRDAQDNILSENEYNYAH